MGIQTFLKQMQMRLKLESGFSVLAIDAESCLSLRTNLPLPYTVRVVKLGKQDEQNI